MYTRKCRKELKNLDERFIKQYDIVEADLGQQTGDEKSGKRPCVVISNNDYNANSNNLVVAPMTKLANKLKENKNCVLDTHVILSNKFYHNLRFSSVIQLEDIRSISKERLTKYLGDLTEQSIEQTKKCLRILLDL